MSEAKFTKGLWKVFKKEDGLMVVGKVGIIEGGDSIVVADCNDWLFKEKQHNAHLIAAAPEMYDFIKKVFDIQKNHCGYAMELHMAMIKLAEESEQLLAKARGEL